MSDSGGVSIFSKVLIPPLFVSSGPIGVLSGSMPLAGVDDAGGGGLPWVLSLLAARSGGE